MINKTYAFYSDIDCYQNSEIFAYHLSLLDETRKAHVLSFKNIDDQKLSLGVSILFLKALKKLNLKKHPLVIDENGKPHTDEYHFNFSHSVNKVMVVISNLEVGCDVEKSDNIRINIAKHCFSENEYKEVLKDNSKFVRYWTLKESYIKALGTGLRTPLSSFEIDLINSQIKNPLSREFYYLREYFNVNGYNLSLASQNKDISELEYISLVD